MMVTPGILFTTSAASLSGVRIIISAETPVTTTQTVAETPITTTQTVAETPVTETNKTNSNVSYCVQIGAYTNSAVLSSKLAGMYRISENIKSEMAGGFTKFMVGKHDEYKCYFLHFYI